MIAANLAAIRRQIGTTTLIAVSKTHPAESIRQALEADQRVFGENRVHEAQSKFPALREAYPDIELHLIGALQSNKARDAVLLFDVIQTLDRPSLAKALADAIHKTGRRPRLYIEVNIGHEPQKAGIAPSEFGNFLDDCRTVYRLTISGLMCIPPHDQDPTPFFTHLHQLATQYHLPHISMGMSGDYHQAIACGATEIRVGSAIFGQRPSQ